MDREKEQYGYWGKFHMFLDGKMRKIYIGPMTRTEMLEDFDAFRHNFCLVLPDVTETDGF